MAGFVLASAALLSTHAWAQVERSGGGANAQIMQQYQQLAADRTRLQNENAQLKKELDDSKLALKTATTQLAAKKTGADSERAQIAAAQAAKLSSEQSLKQTKDKLKDLLDHYRETATTLHEVETKRAQLDQQLSATSVKYDQCVVRNEELAAISDDVLNRYEHQKGFTALARAEPFTRITQTRIENLVDEDRERAEQLRLKKAAAAPGAAPETQH